MLKRITVASALAVSVARARERLHIDSADFDADLESLILAATTALESHTGLVLAPASFEYRADAWPSDVWPARFDGSVLWSGPILQIPAAPVRDITAITYLDADHAEQTVDPANYSWERTTEGADIYFADGYTFPSISSRLNSIRVAFTAGYEDPAESGSGDDPELELDPRAEVAILFLVAYWHRNREPVNIGNIVNDLPQTFEYLARQLRIYR